MSPVRKCVFLCVCACVCLCKCMCRSRVGGKARLLRSSSNGQFPCEVDDGLILLAKVTNVYPLYSSYLGKKD